MKNGEPGELNIEIEGTKGWGEGGMKRGRCTDSILDEGLLEVRRSRGGLGEQRGCDGGCVKLTVRCNRSLALTFILLPDENNK